MKAITKGVVSELADCQDCSWHNYDEDAATRRAAQYHAARHHHLVVIQIAKVLHYDGRHLKPVHHTPNTS